MNLDLTDAVHYHYDKFPPKSLDYSRLVIPLTKATDAVARYDQMLKNMHNSEILLAPLRNQEAVISSRMEGTVSTMDEILRYQADNEAENGNAQHQNVRSDVIETILYQRALKGAQQAIEDGYDFTPSMLKQIHQQLLHFGRGAAKDPGQFKREQNYIADPRKIRFIPIMPELLQDGIEKLFEYINEDNSTPVLIKTAIAHIEFEALHPFKDGNGRIGRMLITLMLWTSQTIVAPHFYVSSYLEDNKNQYIDLMRTVSETGEWESWCEFFLIALEKQAQQNLDIAERIKVLYENMKITFAEELSSKFSVAALDYIFTNPVFRSNKFKTNSGIPKPTAQRFIKVLSDKGLIKTLEESSGRRPALFSFEPLMELVRV